MTLPVGTWLIAFNLLAASADVCCVLRNLTTSSFGKRKNVFGSKSAIDSSTPLSKRLLLLHLTFTFKRACQSEVFTMSALSGPEQKEVSTIDKRTDHRKALYRRRFVRDCPSPRPDQRRLVVCSPRSSSKLRELVEVWNGCVCRRNEKRRFFLSNHRRFRSNFS